MSWEELDGQQEALNAKVDRIVAAVEERLDEASRKPMEHIDPEQLARHCNSAWPSWKKPIPI